MNTEKIEIFKEYTSPVTGISMRFVPVAYYKTKLKVAAIERQFREAGKPIDPPTYEVELPGGNIQHHEYYYNVDLKTDKVDTNIETDEEQSKWDNYLKARRELDEETNFEILKFNFTNGIIIDIPNDGWEAQQIKDGIEIPTDENERKFHYLMTEAITTRFEQVTVSNDIISISMLGISDAIDTAESVKKFFRRGAGKKMENET